MKLLRGWPLLGAFAVFCAGASTFDVAPIRADLSATHRMAVITLTNADAQPVVIQVQIEKWAQVNGVELLDDTREILATPPVLQVPGQGEQVIRIALRREPEESHELTYRVILQEIPQAAPKDFTGLQVALRLSVPVFIAPSLSKPASRLIWDVHRGGTDELVLGVLNEGTVHAQVFDVALDFPAGVTPLTSNIARYVLAGSRVSWTLKLTRGIAPHVGLTVHGHATDGEFSQSVELSER